MAAEVDSVSLEQRRNRFPIAWARLSYHSAWWDHSVAGWPETKMNTHGGVEEQDRDLAQAKPDKQEKRQARIRNTFLRARK